MIDVTEVKRYLKIKDSKELDERIREICVALESKITPRVIGGSYSVTKIEDGYLLGGTDVIFRGKLIERTLRGCESIFLFVITLTTMSDNMLREYSAVDMSKAVILNACMTAYLEGFADDYQDKLATVQESKQKSITRRISCGYGDFDIAYQPIIIKLLQADKYLGVYCNSNNMLTPVKSITALVGVGDKLDQSKNKPDCIDCNKKDCGYKNEK